MNILLVAPQPFFQERGTPIAVDLLARSLSEQGHTIDLLVFNEGEDRVHNGVSLHRVKSFPTITGLKPGFSLKKIYLDIWLFFKLIKMLLSKKYDVVHAVEESVFFAMLLRPIFRFKYINDIDSSMTTQLVDKLPALNKIEKLFRFVESLPMRFADAVVPVCDALADEVTKYRSDGVFVLKDIDLTDIPDEDDFSLSTDENVRTLFTQPDSPLFMYIGNLESYQGIDLLLDGMAKIKAAKAEANLVVIGGDPRDVAAYKQKAQNLNIQNSVQFVGKRPVKGLAYFMQQSDFLVSPRTQGVNTPMKVYSYLGSGKPVLATNLATHTQVMTKETAVLAEPNSVDFSAAMLSMVKSPENYSSIADAAAVFIQQEHSYASFNATLRSIYNSLELSNNSLEPN